MGHEYVFTESEILPYLAYHAMIIVIFAKKKAIG